MLGEFRAYLDPSGGNPPPSEPREKLRQSPEIGIYDENDRLRRVAIWGPVGAEAVLAQIYPKDTSLFYDEMDVVIARREAEGFESALRSQGVEVHLMRDVLAQGYLPSDPRRTELATGTTRDGLIKELSERAQGIFDKHYLPDGRMKDTGEFPKDNDDMPIIKKVSYYQSAIATLVDMDIERYGLTEAVMLNTYLSLNQDLPMGNSIYARDQMNVILGTRFVSSMAREIRQKEVPTFEALYLGLGFEPGVEMPDGETFEGGDAYVHNGIVYVGVGVRTSEGAAKHIYKTLKSNGQLDAGKGFRFVMVKDVNIDTKTEDELQEFMHLDTFSNPIGANEMVVCEVETPNRHAIELTTGESGELIETDHGGFVDFLKSEGNEVYPVPIEAQKEFACNFLAIDGNTIFMADTQDEANTKVSDMLEELGKTVMRIPLRESTRGYGASHCMTGQLLRKE